MTISKLWGGVYDHCVRVNKINILDVRASCQRVRRRRLQILRHYASQSLTGAHSPVRRQKYVRWTPTQRLIFIVRYQYLNMFLFAANHRHNRRGLCSLLRHSLFFMSDADNDHATYKDGKQYQGNRDLEMAGNHGRTPIWLRTWAI